MNIVSSCKSLKISSEGCHNSFCTSYNIKWVNNFHLGSRSIRIMQSEIAKPGSNHISNYNFIEVHISGIL